MFESFTWESLFPFMRFLLFVGGVAAMVTFVFVLRNLALLLDSTKRTMDETEKAVVELRTSIVPILDKADDSMEQLNIKMGRLDGILTNFESTSTKVAHTAEAASSAVQTPVDFVTGVTDRLMRGWRERKAHAQDQQDQENQQDFQEHQDLP
jgi:uncharacterized protein YoxC